MKTYVKILIVLFIIAWLASLLISPKIGNVAVVPITGIITFGEGGIFDATTDADKTIALIKEIDNDPSIEAIILSINSPGGTIVATDDIATAVKQTKKPTVALIRDIGTSGAYWLASSTDHIIANPASMTGSIGATISYLSFEQFLEDKNITYNRLNAGSLKDMGSPFKGLTKEEQEKFDTMLEHVHDYFVQAVADNRNLSKEHVQNLATGEIFLGMQGKENGLVDELGNMDTAMQYIETTLDIKAAPRFYAEKKGFWQSVFGVSTQAGPRIGLSTP